jgi:hypothetical protein
VGNRLSRLSEFGRSVATFRLLEVEANNLGVRLTEGSVRKSVPALQPMRIAIKMLRGELEQFGIFECLHLMNQTARDVHTIASFQFELFDDLGIISLHHPDFKPPGAQVKRFCFNLVEM